MKPYILITIVIISSLINCNYFGATTLAAYFFYTVAIAIASLYTWLPLFKIKQPVLIAYPLPIYCFILLTLFYIVHSYFNAFFDVRLFLLIGNCLLLISNSILINTKAININKLFKIISILAFIESLVCICQYIKLVPSLNMYFPVTGTWGNPNVIAIFLAMALPSTISLLFFSSYKNKCLGLVMLPFIGFAIVILKCRTAYIGAIITAVMITSFYYASIFNLNTFLKSFKVLAVIILSIACLSILSFFLYKMKLASADGRVFIWKISSRLVQYYPISGVGLGNFEQAYNLQQANYFNNEAFTKTEVLNASFINMAYNDFLQHAVEGGFIGLILFLGLLISLLVKRHQFNKETSHIVFSYIGITSFTTMCFLIL